jgi:ATP-dependent exoDNAse (exonuclease V) beta subunit
VEASEYRTIAAAHFDGAQRLANIEKLFALAERFEKAGAYLIRDFVRFVREFEEAGGRESEGQIDDSADAVRLMSIHQSKGLEFPVVIIPDLHRQADNRREWWAVDRHLGLTLKVPDGRGMRVPGSTFSTFTERAKRREEFESMRLIYVAATRAQDRLILSGAARDLRSLRSSWLGSICNALGLGAGSATGLINPAENVVLRLTLNLLDAPQCARSPEVSQAAQADLTPPSDESFPLLEPIESDYSTALYRFSVTQLLNYQRCARQYYFDRVLHAPADEEIAIWNDAEAPEPPANLTATLRGAVIHRFCEEFRAGDDPDDCLKSSFDHVLRQRSAELGERVLEIDPDKAVRELESLARNYVASNVRRRVEAARAITPPDSTTYRNLGVLSEQRFRLRRPLGILTGTIDKLLVFPASNGQGLSVEIIDFKTNRFRARRDTQLNFDEGSPSNAECKTGHKTRKPAELDQLSFQFFHRAFALDDDRELLMRAEIEAAAVEYRVQMQAYALAARDLIPGVADVRVTLHFLDPDVEVCLPDELLEREVCASAIDEIMAALVSSVLPASFPANPASHCRVCSFVEICDAGRQFLREV